MNLFIIPTNTCFWLACPIWDIESYKKIYELKNRPLDKPLAIMVDSFEWLEENTTLNKQQIEFLKNYKNPFTILCETKKDLLDKNIPNKSIYQKIAFRVAHNFIQRKLIMKNWPLFLTSANKSWDNEITTTKWILEVFSREDWTQIFAHREYEIPWDKTASDIFEFVWDSLEVKYLRN